MTRVAPVGYKSSRLSSRNFTVLFKQDLETTQRLDKIENHEVGLYHFVFVSCCDFQDLCCSLGNNWQIGL